jgi:hypothetical protein
MRKFRFIGNSSDWEWDVNPIKRGIYSMELLNKMRGGDPVDDDLVDCKWGKENFEEVFEDETENIEIPVLGANRTSIYEKAKTLHKDTDLGYFAGVAMQGILQDSNWITNPIEAAKRALEYSKELIKQLDQEAK